MLSFTRLRFPALTMTALAALAVAAVPALSTPAPHQDAPPTPPLFETYVLNATSDQAQHTHHMNQRGEILSAGTVYSHDFSHPVATFDEYATSVRFINNTHQGVGSPALHGAPVSITCHGVWSSAGEFSCPRQTLGTKTWGLNERGSYLWSERYSYRGHPQSGLSTVDGKKFTRVAGPTPEYVTWPQQLADDNTILGTGKEALRFVDPHVATPAKEASTLASTESVVSDAATVKVPTPRTTPLPPAPTLPARNLPDRAVLVEPGHPARFLAGPSPQWQTYGHAISTNGQHLAGVGRPPGSRHHAPLLLHRNAAATVLPNPHPNATWTPHTITTSGTALFTVSGRIHDGKWGEQAMLWHGNQMVELTPRTVLGEDVTNPRSDFAVVSLLNDGRLLVKAKLAGEWRLVVARIPHES